MRASHGLRSPCVPPYPLSIRRCERVIADLMRGAPFGNAVRGAAALTVLHGGIVGRRPFAKLT
jgi:hypothetical protein